MSVLYLALPSLSADLGADSTEQLWITDSYGFLIAGLLVTMGTLGDRVGRRGLLLIGVAGATLMPSTLALISNMFRIPAQRAVAVGIWMSCFMGAWRSARRQRRLSHPLLDVRLFASRTFTTALLLFLLNGLLMGGTFLLVSQYLQLVEGLSPLRAGLLLVPQARFTDPAGNVLSVLEQK